MKTSVKKVAALKAEAKKAMGVNLDIPLWGKVRLFALAASFELNTQASVAPFKNNTWGINWVDKKGNEYFKSFEGSCFAMSRQEFIEICFGNNRIVNFSKSVA
jgi:hypothetical protein